MGADRRADLDAGAAGAVLLPQLHRRRHPDGRLLHAGLLQRVTELYARDYADLSYPIPEACMTTPPRWFTETKDGHSQWYIERFRTMAAEGVDLGGRGATGRRHGRSPAHGSSTPVAVPGRTAAVLHANGHRGRRSRCGPRTDRGRRAGPPGADLDRGRSRRPRPRCARCSPSPSMPPSSPATCSPSSPPTPSSTSSRGSRTTCGPTASPSSASTPTATTWTDFDRHLQAAGFDPRASIRHLGPASLALTTPTSRSACCASHRASVTRGEPTMSDDRASRP